MTDSITNSNLTLFLAQTISISISIYGVVQVHTVEHLTDPPHTAVSYCQLQSADHHPALLQSVSIAVPGTVELGDNSIYDLCTLLG